MSETTYPMLNDERREEILVVIRPIPIVQTLRIRIDELDEGLCRAFVPRDTIYDGIYQSLHGGIQMTIADSIACFAVMTLAGPDRPMTTTDMNIRFLAPCLTDVHATAQVVKRGRTLCPVSVELTDTSGRVVSIAQVCYMLLDRAPAHFS